MASAMIGHLHADNYALGFRRIEKPLEKALKFNFPTLFWDPLMRAAALRQLGRIDETETALQQLLQIKQDFETRGRYLISRYLKVEEIADIVVEELRKAGLKNIE